MKKAFLLLIFFCLVHKIVAQVTILPTFGDTHNMENTWFISKNGDSIQFDKIRFYLSNFEFETFDNQILRDTVKAHLVDIFEPNTLKIDLQKINFKHIKTMRFDVGIDSLTNISGALGGDLDPQNGMYWAWQSGYINMKIEGRSPQCKSRKNVFQFHIGGYLPPFYALKRVELPLNALNIEPSKALILKMDVSKLFENIVLSTKNNIMMPCKEAVQFADFGVKMFSIKVHEK
jgi:hypothetical protein